MNTHVYMYMCKGNNTFITKSVINFDNFVRF